MNPTIKDYESAADFLGKRDNRPIANNTRLIRDSDCIFIRFHDSRIVSFYPDGKTVFTSDGFRTKTTKDRLNYYLRGFRIYQESGVWYIANNGLNPMVF